MSLDVVMRDLNLEMEE
jgi:hypothetical protein